MGLTLDAYDERDCPEVGHKRAGDEIYDLCKLNDKHCLEEHGLYHCGYYEEYLREKEEE